MGQPKFGLQVKVARGTFGYKTRTFGCEARTFGYKCVLLVTKHVLLVTKRVLEVTNDNFWSRTVRFQLRTKPLVKAVRTRVLSQCQVSDGVEPIASIVHPVEGCEQNDTKGGTWKKKE